MQEIVGSAEFLPPSPESGFARRRKAIHAPGGTRAADLPVGGDPAGHLHFTERSVDESGVEQLRVETETPESADEVVSVGGAIPQENEQARLYQPSDLASLQATPTTPAMPASFAVHLSSHYLLLTVPV